MEEGKLEDGEHWSPVLRFTEVPRHRATNFQLVSDLRL